MRPNTATMGNNMATRQSCRNATASPIATGAAAAVIIEKAFACDRRILLCAWPKRLN